MTMSLNRRLLLAASIVLLAFFGITGLVLERAYRHSAEQAVFDRLQGQVIALIAALEQGDDGRIYLANALAETRFFTAGSGLYGQVGRNDGRDVWHSPSLTVQELAVAPLLRGQHFFGQDRLAPDTPVFVFSLGTSWEENTSFERSYTFTVAEHRQAFDDQLAAYRRLLWGWLAAVALGLLLVQGSILRWGLAPLRRVATELVEIKAGHQQGLNYDYPRELRGLTDNLNALLEAQRCQLRRYREALGNLAHSLKTPLALLQGNAESTQQDASALVQEQVERMAQIIDYQLQRAAAAGQTALTAPVAVATLAGQVLAALDKVYYDKGVVADCLIDVGLEVQLDRQDMMEMLGNLLDNAYKYGRRQVVVTAGLCEHHAGENSGSVFECCVEDDGPGIEASQWRHVLQRGARAGLAQVSGQGIGLAVVQDIVVAYGGQMTLGVSRWRGARVCVHLPLMNTPA